MTKPLKGTALAAHEGRTVYTKTRKRAGDGQALKRSTNVKLGKRIKVKTWRGMPIYTLTLEERATCPRSCAHWSTCYGNNMRFAHRYAAGPELEAQLGRELAELNRKHPNGFAVRLHVLGDFYSVEYVQQWALWLGLFPALHVWGYTARHDDDIAEALADVAWVYADRWKVRRSGDFESNTMTALSGDDPRALAMLRDREAFICPEQTGAVAGCADCGACWAGKSPVVFLTH